MSCHATLFQPVSSAMKKRVFGANALTECTAASHAASIGALESDPTPDARVLFSDTDVEQCDRRVDRFYAFYEKSIMLVRALAQCTAASQAVGRSAGWKSTKPAVLRYREEL